MNYFFNHCTWYLRINYTCKCQNVNFRTWVNAQLVEETCGESYQCKYDYATTLSREFAIFTKFYQDSFVNIREGVLKPEARGT